ncbi:hypothetical protein JTB14_002580 [Gonioctena quinquepunctata]|nr:hypothetical protein JTB14_002580 [Gonioctena quinquepunctata]
MQLKRRSLQFLCGDCTSGLHQVPALIKAISDLRSEVEGVKIAKPPRPQSSSRDVTAEYLCLQDDVSGTTPQATGEKLRVSAHRELVVGPSATFGDGDLGEHLWKQTIEKKQGITMKIFSALDPNNTSLVSS